MPLFKKEVRNLIIREDFPGNIERLNDYPPKKLINILISFIYNPDEILKDRSILALGYTVAKIAEEDIEYARVIMRRLMLSLTEESGGIGWGAPEAMGEIMAMNYQLALEYHKILISYTPGGGNELEFEELQKDVIAGLKRLASRHPHLVEEVKHLL
jgi:hypothetical protein